MDRARKKIASAIDGIRNNLHMKVELDVEEHISSEHCLLSKIVRHGFPDDPRCLAFDPVQKLIAIGGGHGTIRLLGKSGVDYMLKHESDEPVIHAAFLINEGGLVTVQRDDTIHLWNYRQKIPEIVNSMQMSKERVTCLYLPFQSKWVYIGTDKGNVYFVCLANFELSTYVINWNKAIDLSCRIHPGSIKQLALSPTETNKLLICFEKSHLSMWNLQTKEAEQFGINQPQIKCIYWHHDGKQFMCGHADGSLTIWNIKKSTEPQQKIYPHSNTTNCTPIPNLIWHNNQENEQLVIFVGGLPSDDGVLPAVSIMRGKPTKSTIVAEMDHSIINIATLNSSPYNNIPQHPYGIAVLLKSDFLVIDLNSTNFSCFESPYPMDIHESPVTYIKYYSDCPVDLIAALTLVGRNQRKQGIKLSDKQWPINGGIGRECATGHQEMLLTGHEDGSIKFWQASSENLQIMYKLKTGRHFEKIDENRSVSYGITGIELDLDSRLLLVSGLCGQVTLFRFVKTESSQDIAVVTINQLCSSDNLTLSQGTNQDDDIKSIAKELRKQLETTNSTDSHSTATSVGSEYTEQTPIKVRGGSMRRPAGYQPELVCMIPWIEGTTPEKITAMAINSSYGVIAIGTPAGMALVDIVSYTLIYSWSNSELLGREPITLNLQQQNSDPSPSESMHSSMASPIVQNSSKNFMRLNTEKSRSIDRRPILAKAQSIAASAAAMMTSNNSNTGSEVNSPSHGYNNDLSNGDSTKNLNGSKSSSVTSLEKINPIPEYVTSLTFISCASKRNNSKSETCLWLGLSTGALTAFILQLPVDRITSSVIAAPSDMYDGPKGSIIRLQDRILYTGFMNRNMCLITGASESYKDPTKDSAPTSANVEKALQNKILTRTSLSPSVSNGESGLGLPPPEELTQLGIFVSEYDIKIIALPLYQQLYYVKPDIPLVKARTTHIRGYPVLICLSAAGQVVVYSLPSLRLLLQQPLFKCSVDFDDPICQKTEFNEHGLGMYMASQSELQKFAMCSELASQVADCSGELFVPVDMPEPPKTSFFKGVSTLFANQKESVDLDNIFSDKQNSVAIAGMKSIARTLPVSNNMDQINSRNITAGQAAMQAIQNLNERGERLNAVVDATENLRNNAMNLQNRSSALAQKYEKKKWYQL